MKNSKSLRLVMPLLFILIGFVSHSQDLYLDMEPPDADVRADGSTAYQYYEGGNKYRRETAQSWGFGQLVSDGRNPSSPNSLEAVWPANSNSGATNRMEWKFKTWVPNINYWTGFSVKFDDNYPTPLNGQQGTMFSQLKNSGQGAQVKWYLTNKASTSDPLEFWCQIQYGQSASNRQFVNIRPGTILPKGEWIDVVSNYKINPNQPDSFVKIWINGELVIDYNGKIGFDTNQGNGGHKIGLYGGSQNALRRMKIDEVRYGDSYVAVDPAQGSMVVPPTPSTYRIEAESADQQSNFSPFQVRANAEASEGEFIDAPGNNSKSVEPSNGNINYVFNLDSAGDTELTARVLADNTSDNSIWLKMDSGAWQPWYFNDISSNWQEVSQSFPNLSSGDHIVTVAYREGGTKLDWFELKTVSPTVPPTSGLLEAESAVSQVEFSPFVVGSNGSASQGEFIHAPGNNSKSVVPSNGNINYVFNLDSAGDTELTARVLADNTSDNSIWLKMDSGAWQPWYFNDISSSWQEVSRSFPNLSSGEHTVTVAYREGGTKLDWFEVVNTSNINTLFEVETLTTTSSGASQQNINNSSASGGAENKLNSDGINDYVEYSLNLPDSGNYNIKVGTKTHSSRGIFKLNLPQAGANVGTVHDLYSSTVSYNEIDIGTYDFQSSGNKQFRFIVVGKNSNSSDYTLVFDYLKLVKVNPSAQLMVNPTIFEDDTAPIVIEPSRINIYPNPTNNLVNVSMSLEENAKLIVSITTLSGRQVSIKELSGYKGDNNFNLNIGDLPKGLYIIMIQAGAQKFSKKLIIESEN